nr:DNA-binding protein [uncultured Cohaesibacter sp.]
MSSQYYTAAEIAQAEGVTERTIYRQAKSEGWNKQTGKARKRPGRGGGWEYRVSLLPDMARARLTIGVGAEEVKAQSSAAWIEYERLSTARKKACEERLKVVDAVADLVRSGMKETHAVAYVAKQKDKSERSIRSWRKKVAHVDRADWLPALADNYKQTAQFDDVHC